MKRRDLGQHYLTDPDVVQRIIAVAEIQPNEWVLEIGTGRGVLTERIAGLCSRFDGFEVDPANYRETLKRLGGARASIHLADVFDERPSFDVLISSLPYSRSLDFVEWLSQLEYGRAVVLLQEDFVKKVLSPPGSRDYRAVSAIVQISSDVRVVEHVGRRAFRPSPRVNSVLVTIRPMVKLTKQQVSDVKWLFSLRRREVYSALSQLGFSGGGVEYGRRRVFSLSPPEVFAICSGARKT